MTRIRILAALAAALVSSAASYADAASLIRRPATGQRLEVGETVVVEWDVDFNNQGVERSEQFHLYLAAERGAEFVLLEVIDRDEPGMTAVDEADGHWAYEWTVPQVTCQECLLRILEVPGRGDYDNSGQVAIAIGTDWVLNGEAGDLGVLAPEAGGTRHSDPRGGTREVIDDVPEPMVAADGGVGGAASSDGGCAVGPRPAGHSAALLLVLGAMALFGLRGARRRGRGGARAGSRTGGRSRALGVTPALVALASLSACASEAGGAGVVPDAEPRPVGTPVPPELIGAEIEGGEEGDPKLEDTFYDEEGEIGLWIPPTIERIRGVHVNLLANPNRGGSLVSSRLDRQLVSTWGFAQLAGWNVWQRDRSSAEQGWAAIEALLAQVAEETGHEELTTAPVIITGGSRTGRWGTTIANLAPERTLAYVTLVAGAAPDRNRTDALFRTPGLLVPGENDGGADKIAGVEELRAQGAMVAGAMMWGRGHTCGPCEEIIYPFLDSVIRARLRDGGMVGLDGEGSWLGEHVGWTAFPREDFPADPASASWLVDDHFGNVWRAFTLREPAGELTEPRLVGRSPRVSELGASELTEVAGQIEGVTGLVQLYDGASRVSEAAVAEDGSVVFEGLALAPGIHSLLVMQGAQPLTRPSLVVLLEG